MDLAHQTDDFWRQKLSPEQYAVLRQQGTEPPFTGLYYDHHDQGEYRCAACGNLVFDSTTKFASGSGWPSFWAAARPDSVELRSDDSHGMHRTEIVCKRCGGHLGHMFEGGPQPTGQYYCVNSAALDFAPTDSTAGGAASGRPPRPLN